MNHKTATPVILTVSLMLLLGGTIGAAAQDRGVRDNLSPVANAAIVGLARGSVMWRDSFAGVRDDLSPLRATTPVLVPTETPTTTPTATPDIVDDLSPLRGGR
ncbi:hypothetical protein EDM22_04500 [Agromyces tardus]|jgi:hypothetical protein|uniref:Secreted protein n=1 Tax=Agromyces tardus TaxID=2583849 RepID=A0A3M8AJ78_9MICO|nr:hypothetical protein [Agromyces tardus]RNB51296.1 hypothetical protein EDM22_04500 [Agromyces tardus]